MDRTSLDWVSLFKNGLSAVSKPSLCCDDAIFDSVASLVS